MRKKVVIFFIALVSILTATVTALNDGDIFGASRFSPGGGSPLSPGFWKLEGTVLAPTNNSWTVSSTGSGTTVPNVEIYSTTTLTVYSTTTIPLDDTIPQIGEGSQFLSGTITTQNASSKVKGTVTVFGGPSVNLAFLIIAFFRDSGVNAVGACSIRETSELHTYVCEFEDSPGATGTYTYSARLGISSGNFTVNGIAGSRFFGGSAETILTLQEVLP